MNKKLINNPTYYQAKGLVNNKVLSDAEFSRLRQFIEDVLQLCAEDEDLDVEIGYEAETVGEILGVFPDQTREEDDE